MIRTIDGKRDAADTFVHLRAVMGQLGMKFISTRVSDTAATICAMRRWQIPARNVRDHEAPAFV
jgi:hypothetical protein